jgi:hypothetical protein
MEVRNTDKQADCRVVACTGICSLRHGFAFGFWLRDHAGVRSSFVRALLLIRSLLRSLFRAIFESTPAAPPSRAPPRAMPWAVPQDSEERRDVASNVSTAGCEFGVADVMNGPRLAWRRTCRRRLSGRWRWPELRGFRCLGVASCIPAGHRAKFRSMATMADIR